MKPTFAKHGLRDKAIGSPKAIYVIPLVLVLGGCATSNESGGSSSFLSDFGKGLARSNCAQKLQSALETVLGRSLDFSEQRMTYRKCDEDGMAYLAVEQEAARISAQRRSNNQQPQISPRYSCTRVGSKLECDPY